MNSNIPKANEEFKHFCAGKDCNNRAVTQIVIKFVHKSGWFCDSCAAELIELGLNDLEDTRLNDFQGQ